MKNLFYTIMIVFALLYTAPVKAEKIVLRMGTNDNFRDPPKVGGQIAFQWLQKMVTERTNGEIEIKIYPGAQLGAEKDAVKLLNSGGIDIQPDISGNQAAFVPELGLFSASYLFTGFAHFERVITNERFFNRLKQIVQDRKLGYQLTGIGTTGSRNVYNRTLAVSTPTDLKGLKMRVMSSPMEYKVWSKLGMLPSSIVSTEIYSALQSGVVDAAESSIPYIVSNKYYEVAPFISLTNHQIGLQLYFIGDKALAKVPQRHRDAVLKTLYETGRIHIQATARLSEQELEELRAKRNVKVSVVDPAPFISILRPLQDEVAKELGVEDLLKMIRENQ